MAPLWLCPASSSPYWRRTSSKMAAFLFRCHCNLSWAAKKCLCRCDEALEFKINFESHEDHINRHILYIFYCCIDSINKWIFFRFGFIQLQAFPMSGGKGLTLSGPYADSSAKIKKHSGQTAFVACALRLPGPRHAAFSSLCGGSSSPPCCSKATAAEARCRPSNMKKSFGYLVHVLDNIHNSNNLATLTED